MSPPDDRSKFLPRLAIQRPITTSMLLLSILVFGGVAVTRLPLAFLPEVDVPFIGIEIPYPNANPTQIEKEIVKPVEEILATLSGIKKMRSTADADSAQIFLQFDWGEDLDLVRMAVSEKVDQVKPELPEGIGEVLIFSFNTSDIPVVQGRISADGVDLSASYELIETRILNRLRRVPGVARVDIDGVAPREIFIDLVFDKVREHGVDIGPLIDQLRGAGAKVVLGQVSDKGLRYAARAVGSYGSVDALRDLVIDERGLRLGEIADVSYEEPPIAYSRHLNLQDAIAVTVFKESTANTVDVVRGVERVIAEDIAADPLLQGISFFTWQNQADQILNSLNGLTNAGVVGGLLAILVLYVFLRQLGPTFIVSLSIPFSIIASCGILYFLGKNLNILSMMGLMLGVGMLVDNAIVVLESIDRRRREEPDAIKASLTGSSSVSSAVVASTATSLIVFLPLVVGDKAELTTWLGEIGLAICLALACSLVSSLTLIPLAAAHILASRRRSEPRPMPAWLRRLEERYAGVLAWTLDHPWKMTGVLLLIFGVAIAPFPTGLVKTATFSAAVNERMFLHYEFSEFLYKSEVEKAVDEVERFLDAHKEEYSIASIYSYYRSDEAQTTLNLTRKDLDDDAVKALRKKIREALPVIAGVKLSFDEDTDQGGGSTYFSVNFFGQDVTVLSHLATEAQRRIETIPGIADVRSSLRDSSKEIEVHIDRDKAAQLGITAEEVSEAFGFTLGGLRLPRFDAGDREVETWLALRIEDRENVEDLKQLSFRQVEGRPVTLGDIASFEIVDRPQEIQRENRKVRVGVRATYEGEDWPKVREKIEGLMDAFSLPGGYSWSWNDRILEQDDEGKQMGYNMLLALAMVYIVMAALFQSLTQPFAILFSIPFALPGIVWMLAATRTPFNLMAQIGILILMGIVVNNGIVLLDHMNQLRQEGVERRAAILQAGRDRMRAILMTATTTIVGLLPLAIGKSTAGGLFYYPLALTVMGGLLSSTFLTLVVLPFVNDRVESFAAWAVHLWRASALPAEAEPGDDVDAEPASEPA